MNVECDTIWTEMTTTTTSRDRARASPASSPTTPSTMDARATRVDEDGSSRRVAETIELFESKSKSKSATPRTPRTRTGEDASEETVSPMRAADLERALVGAFERFGSFGRRRRSGGRARRRRWDGTRFAKLAKEVVFAGEDEEKLRMAEIGVRQEGAVGSTRGLRDVSTVDFGGLRRHRRRRRD